MVINNTVEVFIALGANLGEREATLAKAISAIAEGLGNIKKASKFYETEPVNHPSTPDLVQPNYLNAVIQVDSLMAEPREILDFLLKLERQLGRERRSESTRWGPRVIDLDIIAIGDMVIETEELVVPHRELHRRLFVLEPLVEIAPDWRHPILGKSATELLLAMS